MGKGTLGQVVKRAISDAGFRRQLQSDPEGALKGFDLTSDERAALRSGDASKLSSLGIDQRMSKTFEMGAGASAVSKWGTGNDLAMGANVPDGGEPLVNDALISGGGGRASDALIGEATGAQSARITDAGGVVRAGITSEGTGVRTALGDQHDGGRAAIGDNAGGARAALTDAERLAQVNAAFEGGDNAGGARTALTDADRLAQANAAFEGGDAAGGRSALDNSGTASREGTAYITADEAGNDVIAGGSAGAQSSLDVSGQTRGDAIISESSGTIAYTERSSDEGHLSVIGDSTGSSARGAFAAPIDGSPEAAMAAPAGTGTDEYLTQVNVGGGSPSVSSLDVSGQTRGDAFITADEAGSSHPSLSAAERLAGETLPAETAVNYGQQSSLDVSGQTRDTSVSADAASGRATDAFITADEMGNDATARGHASYPDSADTQREALANDAAMANPEGYTKPDLDA